MGTVGIFAFRTHYSDFKEQGLLKMRSLDCSPVLGFFNEGLFKTAKGTYNMPWNTRFHYLNGRRF
jgi:hypothetical protein